MSDVRVALLGAELRTQRDRVGLSLAEVTAKVGISAAKLSRMENGRAPQAPDDVAALLGLYGVTGLNRDDLIDLAASLADGSGGPSGSDSALRFLESRAAMLVDYQSALVPELLQTVPYAQAALREVAMLDDDDRWTQRIHRQSVLRRPNPPRYYAIIAEAALRTAVGGPDVLREQLRYLVEAGGRRSVTIRLIPDLPHGHPGLGGPFQRLQFPHRGAVVVLDKRTSRLFVEDPAEVRHYDRVVVELLSTALSEEESLARIARLAR
ncbi:helix-turn-helix domain-containing protein [Actinokineospora sp. NPDC004072]